MEFPFEGIPTVPPRKDMDHLAFFCGGCRWVAARGQAAAWGHRLPGAVANLAGSARINGRCQLASVGRQDQPGSAAGLPSGPPWQRPPAAQRAALFDSLQALPPCTAGPPVSMPAGTGSLPTQTGKWNE
jgi:hypothetical protein